MRASATKRRPYCIGFGVLLPYCSWVICRFADNFLVRITYINILTTKSPSQCLLVVCFEHCGKKTRRKFLRCSLAWIVCLIITGCYLTPSHSSLLRFRSLSPFVTLRPYPAPWLKLVQVVCYCHCLSQVHKRLSHALTRYGYCHEYS